MAPATGFGDRSPFRETFDFTSTSRGWHWTIESLVANSASPNLVIRTAMGRLLPFARFGFLTILIVIQCLGPLLHAHMGTPHQTGFHLDIPMPGLFRIVLDERKAQAGADAAAPAASAAQAVPHADDEPFSIDVEKGLSHAGPGLDVDPSMIEALLALCAVLLVLAAWVAWPLVRAAIPHRLRWRGGSSHPPPAHAPPLYS